MRAQKRAPGSVTARVAPAIVRHIYNHRFEPGAPFLAFRVRWARIIGVLDSLPVTVSSERRQVASSAIMRRRITRRRTIKGRRSKLCGSIKRQVGHQRSLAIRRVFCTACRARRSVRDATAAVANMTHTLKFRNPAEYSPPVRDVFLYRPALNGMNWNQVAKVQVSVIRKPVYR